MNNHYTLEASNYVEIAARFQSRLHAIVEHSRPEAAGSLAPTTGAFPHFDFLLVFFSVRVIIDPVEPFVN